MGKRQGVSFGGAAAVSGTGAGYPCRGASWPGRGKRGPAKARRPHCPLAVGGGNGCTLDRIRNPVLCRRGMCNGLDSAVDICQSVRSLSGALGRCADIAPDLERRSKRIEEPGGSRVFCIHTSFCTPHYVIFQIALGADLCYNTNTIYAMMRKEGTGDEGSFQFEGAAA